MKINRFMIAAPKSGSGKTMITCALLQLLKDSGKNVLSYKCGPDYIDPMFHKKVLGVPSKNLDTFFTDEKTTVQLFLDERADGDFAVLEGVMGLYDGLGGIYEQGSSYHLAKVTQTPIILVVDAKGMGKSVLALIAGFLQYDTQHLIKGVLLNRMSKGYYDIIKPLIEKELSVKVVGYFPEQKDIGLSSRHLGLIMPDELSDIKKQLNETADRLKKTIDMDLFIDIAEAADEIGDSESADVYNEKNIGNCDQNEFSQNKAINTVNIAVAMDEAFCFYYEDNLRMLEKCGAQLQYFSPLHDTELPDNCDALLLGGGYPELYAKELSENISMRKSIKTAFEAGRPDADDLQKAEQFGRESLKKLQESTFPLPSFFIKGNIPYKPLPAGNNATPVCNDLCYACGNCIEVCPTHAIRLSADGSQIETIAERCIRCCACVKECPTGARIFDSPFTAILHEKFSARREPETFL